MRRAAAVAGALIVTAFFALSVRQATSADAARHRLDAGRSDARTAALLDHAGQLNPGADVDVARARLAVLRHDLPRARRILLAIVRREPDNAVAWGTLTFVFARADRPLARRAARHLRALVPQVPEP